MTEDVIELRLPPKTEYLPIIRATVGVIAGALSFNYDEIIQMRVAVSEAFSLAVSYVKRDGQVLEENAMTVRFAIEPGKIQFLIHPPEHYTDAGRFNNSEQTESEALIDSLMDDLEFGAGAPGKPMIRAVKFKSEGEA